MNESLPEISPAEMADLEREAGRPLTTRTAHEFRIRKIQRGAVEAMLNKTAEIPVRRER